MGNLKPLKLKRPLFKSKSLAKMVLASGLWSTPLFAQSQAQAIIAQQGETIHLELSGKNQWDYQISRQKDPQGKENILVSVPSLSPSDMKDLENFRHPLIEKISVNPKGADGKTVITFVPKVANLESFDYLTEKPSRLIVDFFIPTPEKVAAAPKKSVPTQEKKSVQLPPKTRAPASTDVLAINDQGMPLTAAELGNLSAEIPQEKAKSMGSMFDGGDPNYERFSIKDYEIKEDSIIGSREKIYIEFPMLRLPSHYLSLLKTKKPVYEIAPEETEENKQARLLLTLFDNGRYNVFLQTADWFNKKFPNSKYDEMVQFMKADAHYAIWEKSRNADDFDQAMMKYRQALQKYPESPLLERTMMLIGFSTLDRGDYLSTLRLFQSHLQKRPSSPNRDIAKFAIADAYLKISRFDEAIQIYRELEKEAVSQKRQNSGLLFSR